MVIHNFSDNLSKFERIPELIREEIQYPSIVFVVEPTLESTFKNYNYAEKMSQVFQRFDAICRFHDVCCQVNSFLLIFCGLQINKYSWFSYRLKVVSTSPISATLMMPIILNIGSPNGHTKNRTTVGLFIRFPMVQME